MTLGEKIKSRRKQLRMSQQDFAESVSISQAAVSQWEIGKTMPGIDMIHRIAEVLNTSYEWLIGIEEERTESAWVPALGTVRGGIPNTAVEDIDDYEELSPELVSTGAEYFALKVRGDSMAPLMPEGAHIICRKQDTAQDGDICVVLVNGDEATVKRIKLLPEGLMLIGANPSFQPIVYTASEIMSLPVKVIGKAVEVRVTL